MGKQQNRKMKDLSITIFTVILIVCVKNSQSVSSFGKCPKIPVFDLDLDSYKGTWYEMAKFPNAYQPGLKCTTQILSTFINDSTGQVEPTKVKVVNSGFSNFLGLNKSVTIDGFAALKNPETPNQLKLKFNIVILGQQVFTTPDGDYNVLKTNYDGYSLIYTCSESNYGIFTRKSETAWIMSRTNRMDSSTFNSLKSVLARYTEYPEELVFTDHKYCGVNSTIF